MHTVVFLFSAALAKDIEIFCLLIWLYNLPTSSNVKVVKKSHIIFSLLIYTYPRFVSVFFVCVFVYLFFSFFIYLP